MTLSAPYIYRATVTRVIDGDTFCADVDWGFHRFDRDVPIRLLGAAARELHDDGGPEARDNLAALLPAGTPVLLLTAKPDKYSPRWDASVTYEHDGAIRDLVSGLVADGWCAPWDGRGAQPKPAWPRPAA